MSKLFALDCDSFKIAIAIFENGKLEETVVISADKKLDSSKRGFELFTKFNNFLEKAYPDIVVTERSLYNQNFVSSRIITEIIAYCKLACQQKGIQFNQVYVSSWKKGATGKGNASKAEVKEAVLKEFPQFSEITYDESDACGIGMHYLKIIDDNEKA